MPYNIISCKGFIAENASTTMDIGGACSKAKLILVLLFFLNAVVRKWGGEEAGLDYNFLGGLIGGLVGYLIPLTIFGNVTISFFIGLVCMLIGGYCSSMFLGGGDSE